MDKLSDKELKKLLEKYIEKSDRCSVYESKVLKINKELKNREELRFHMRKK